MITLQITLNFILRASRLKLNTIAQVQKSQDVEEEAMDMVPWDSREGASNLQNEAESSVRNAFFTLPMISSWVQC